MLKFNMDHIYVRKKDHFKRMKRRARYIYIILVLLLITTTVMALLDGGYHIIGGLMAAVAAGGLITSLLLYFISMSLFDRYESHAKSNLTVKVLAIIFFILCFPVNLWVIYSNLEILITGGPGWAFG
ncbi:MAG: hypothetical protein P8P74_10765 [Crocinitomicaceae bacterium]|nr:hypothetical protein [Crocinitomicaceae bacterium]